MNAKVVGSDYNSDAVVQIECPHDNSMGVLESEPCETEIECTDARVGWVIPAQCPTCTNLLGADKNIRAEIEAACDWAVENYDPTPWCSGCGSMTRAGCGCGPRAEND